MKIFGSVVLLFAAFFSSTKGDKSMYKMESYDNGNYKVMWKYDMITDMFYFNVTVKATGWVGFGVSKTKGGMKDYDVMVGGVDKSGKGYAKDYLTTEQAMPMPPDAEQNYNLTNSWEMNGYTSLMFSRKRDTGDTQGDVVIEPGMMYLIWAYHDMYDVNKTANYTFKKHTKRDAVEYTFIEPGFTKVAINNNYAMYWKYNAGEDMFYFKVMAKATGWVAFGVSTQGGGMNGYDVMIGGVNNGTGYIGVSHLKRVHVYAALNSSNGSQGKKKRTREHSSIYP
ncbi:DBH-like monooxygenase protein 1-like [Stylophora pistillata]|uniref:DBH-like monooxygenase protein 1-like n=1 Tax=Stylophora pistillata TaxID=50429 RepID=A0A2B4SEH6_STYPI|nr:DBH-like monooxygenase protein 1-like [Stylophora pistillata]